jgi:hypothetical protein
MKHARVAKEEAECKGWVRNMGERKDENRAMKGKEIRDTKGMMTQAFAPVMKNWHPFQHTPSRHPYNIQVR